MEFWRRDLLGYNKNLDGQKVLGKVVSSSWLGLFQEGRLIRAWQSLKPQTAREFQQVGILAGRKGNILSTQNPSYQILNRDGPERVTGPNF